MPRTEPDEIASFVLNDADYVPAFNRLNHRSAMTSGKAQAGSLGIWSDITTRTCSVRNWPGPVLIAVVFGRLNARSAAGLDHSRGQTFSWISRSVRPSYVQ